MAGVGFFTELYAVAYNGLVVPERRYAEWLPAAERRKQSKLIGAGFALSGSALLLHLALGILLGIHAALRDTVWINGLVLAGTITSVAGVVMDRRRFRSEGPVIDLPETVSQFRVSVNLRREVVYGVTTGLVSFVDGWFVFSGRGLDFAVRREDVTPGIDDGVAEVQFEGLGGEIYLARFRRTKFRGEWTEWAEWARSTKSSDGVSVYPPTTPSPGWHPQAISLWYGLFVVLASCGLAIVLSLPWVALPWSACGSLMVLNYSVEKRSLSRLRAGLPVRRTGILAAIRRFKQGYGFGESARLLIGRGAPRQLK